MFLIAVILLSLLAACQKSASRSPASVTTPTSFVFPTPLPSSAIDNALSGTQTAQAFANPTNPVNQNTASGTNEPASAVATNSPTLEPTQAVPTAVFVPSATPGHPATYTIKLGEYPFCIARRFNVNPEDLLAINGLDYNSYPDEGTVLQIPQSGTWSSGPRELIKHPTTYTVAEGDTIYSIACKFGDVDPNDVAIANGLSSPYMLKTGQVLNIP